MEMLKVYCDANVYLDLFLNRKDSIRPLGHFAFEFFSRGWNCLFALVVSDLVVEELEKYASKKDIEDILGYFKERNKLIFVKCSDEDIKEAKKLSKNWKDALHAVIASKNKCDYLITRDFKHFSDFQSIVGIKHPENV
jgi:predicted nucleic acid-binding protein